MNTTDQNLAAALQYLRPLETPMARLLGQFARRESPTEVKAAVDAFGRDVAAEWRHFGAKVKIVRQKSAGDHLQITWNATAKSRRNPPLLVLGHLDTVYGLGTLKKMPFRLSRGRACGPGVFDMKGGLVIALYAARALRELGWLPSRPVTFLWTADEETGSATSRRLIERAARRSAAVLVLEPASGLDGRLKTQRKGVGTAELAIAGRAAHAGLNPEDGINALSEMALQIQRLMRLNRPRRGITVNATVAQSGRRSNVIPDAARLTLDLRAGTIADMRFVERSLKTLKPLTRGAKLTVTGGFSRPPLERSATAKLFAHAEKLGAALGISLNESHVGGGSDGNFTGALGVPTLDGLGAVGEGAHSPDENVVISALPVRAALLAGLLATL